MSQGEIFTDEELNELEKVDKEIEAGDVYVPPEVKPTVEDEWEEPKDEVDDDDLDASDAELSALERRQANIDIDLDEEDDDDFSFTPLSTLEDDDDLPSDNHLE